MKKLPRYEVRYLLDGAWRSAGRVDTISDLSILMRATRARYGFSTHDRRVRRIDHEHGKTPGMHGHPGGAVRGRMHGVTRRMI